MAASPEGLPTGPAPELETKTEAVQPILDIESPVTTNIDSGARKQFRQMVADYIEFGKLPSEFNFTTPVDERDQLILGIARRLGFEKNAYQYNPHNRTQLDSFVEIVYSSAPYPERYRAFTQLVNTIYELLGVGVMSNPDAMDIYMKRYAAREKEAAKVPAQKTTEGKGKQKVRVQKADGTVAEVVVEERAAPEEVPAEMPTPDQADALFEQLEAMPEKPTAVRVLPCGGDGTQESKYEFDHRTLFSKEFPLQIWLEKWDPYMNSRPRSPQGQNAMLRDYIEAYKKGQNPTIALQAIGRITWKQKAGTPDEREVPKLLVRIVAVDLNEVVQEPAPAGEDDEAEGNEFQAQINKYIALGSGTHADRIDPPKELADQLVLGVTRELGKNYEEISQQTSYAGGVDYADETKQYADIVLNESLHEDERKVGLQGLIKYIQDEIPNP